MYAEDLKGLIKARYGTIRAFAKVVGLSENTVQTHLKDGNWDLNQAVRIIKALHIPKNFAYMYFFEPLLAKNESETA